MKTEFARIITLLRKEKGLSQKQAATELAISQALLSHYEKGIRECGLEFVVKVSNYYDVSADYLLGLSPDRRGVVLSVDDIPISDNAERDKVFKGSMVAVLNKKLLQNSINILFELLQISKNKTVIEEISSFLFVAFYKAFRILFEANPKNPPTLFSIPPTLAQRYADASMAKSEAMALSMCHGKKLPDHSPIEHPEELAISTEILEERYKTCSTSLFNLIQRAEKKISS